jgi:hypothetical protein
MKLNWLAENYIFKKGLRNWTWQVILEGIIQEHLRFLAGKDKIDDEMKYIVRLIWSTFLFVQGIKDLKKVPTIDKPEHEDVKAVLFLYSLESFLYPRLNRISIEKDKSSIMTLGPFAVALTKIIDGV